MSTLIRPEVSKKNRYWISRHRFYELKHYCLQYPEWKACADALLHSSRRQLWDPDKIRSSGISDPTVKTVILREEYLDRMEMIENTAKAASPDLWEYLFKGVTEGLSYDILLARMQIPCCKEVYYDIFRKFFWLLSKIRK